MGAFDATYIKLFDTNPQSSRCLLACGDGRLYVAARDGEKLVVETLQDHDNKFEFDTLVCHGVFHHDDKDETVVVLRFMINNKFVADAADGEHVHLKENKLINVDTYRGLYIERDLGIEGTPQGWPIVMLQSAEHFGRYLAYNEARKDLSLKCPPNETIARNDTELRFSVVLPPKAKDASDFSPDREIEDWHRMPLNEEYYEPILKKLGDGEVEDWHNMHHMDDILHQEVFKRKWGDKIGPSGRTPRFEDTHSGCGVRIPQYVENVWRLPATDLAVQNEFARLKSRVDGLVAAGTSCVLWVVISSGIIRPDVALIDVEMA